MPATRYLGRNIKSFIAIYFLLIIKKIISMLRIYYAVTLLFISITFCSAQKPTKPAIFSSASNSRSEGNFLYNLTTTSATYTDLVNPISINNGEVWDEPEYTFPIGFPFEFLEDEIDGFEFYGSGAYMRAATSDPDVYAYAVPFETDLVDRGALDDDEISLSPISYVVEGEPGNRIFKLEFKNAGSYYEMSDNNTLDMFINFQMWLYEGSNTVQFRYGPSSIDNPALFYAEESGAGIAVADYNEEDDIITNLHFIVGNASNPVLSTNQDMPYITGTPPNGTVYTLSLDLPLEVNLLVSQNNSYCAPNNTIEAEVTGGLSPYTYAWSNGESTALINVIDAGTYTVTVTDQIGNTETSSAVIIIPDPMTLTVDVTDETADSAEDGTAEVTATDGLPAYAYEWSNGETTSLIEGLAPGVYQVTVTDDAGCSETAEAVINPFGCAELFLEASTNHNQCAELCEGSITIVEVINGVAPFTYEWENGDSEASIAELCAGTYAVTVTDANLCFAIATYEITSPAPVVPNASSTNETLAGLNDGTATAAPIGGTPPYIYEWSNGEFTQTITGLAPGTYSVVVGDLFNCHGFDTVVIEAGPCAALTSTVTDASCFGICDGSIVVLLGGLPPAEISWTGGNGGALDGESCADEYIISASDGFGCTVVDTFIVGQPGELIASTGSTSETIAGDDGTAWVTPFGGTPPYTYLWNTGSTDSLITGLVADTYFIMLTDANGCTDVDSVQVEPFYCFHIIPDDIDNVFCHDSCDGLIFVTIQGGVGPFEYEWSNGDTSNIIVDLCAGWYSVTVTDLGQGSCEDFIDIEITEPDSFYVIVDEIVHATDSTDGSIQLSTRGGTSPYDYVWFGPDLFLSFEEDISDLAPGEYIYFAYDSNECELTDTIEIFDLIDGLPILAEGVVSIYPNPAKDFLYVKTEVQGDYKVDLFSALGAVVGSWQNATSIDVGHLPSGIYLVAFSNESGRYVERVVIK